jgi:hypothetical protein
MTQIDSANQNQTSSPNDVRLECIIKTQAGVLHYKGVKEVRKDLYHITVRLYEEYMVNNREILVQSNVSTTAYVHQFYNGTIVAVKGMK